MITEPELLNERLERLAMVLDGIMPNCASLVRDALDLLKEQERKKGSWDYGTQCSVCKWTIIPPKDRKVRINFCPWCGADMRDSYE